MQPNYKTCEQVYYSDIQRYMTESLRLNFFVVKAIVLMLNTDAANQLLKNELNETIHAKT